ncbi:LSU ribosomal protein L24P [Tistlia consotensis]|uniref:Large ribosomal subunit protein uL24 n=1 Tax=Tistlia consotensis USBA 355 TaxID=560819 RepID=A0A1Y6C8V5_9PROT|nr:50S ribosomal protein L24 [Tistlia consotensis]SMF42969.1 LSU ribosomal protein L24P [Tistlia consotensis USBA 355]SNR42020.1 LSU ribosomal protein L24P [Tistlia consotensis]
MKKFKIRKGDRVVVTTGKDRGKSGEVLRVLRKDDRVLVQGVNLVKKHQRQTARQEGGIVEVEAPVHISNVAHADPNDGKAARVGWKVLEDGRKVRFSRRSGEMIDR